MQIYYINILIILYKYYKNNHATNNGISRLSASMRIEYLLILNSIIESVLNLFRFVILSRFVCDLPIFSVMSTSLIPVRFPQDVRRYIEEPS